MMLMIPNGYEKAEPGAMPDAKAVAAMMKYNESLQRPECCSPGPYALQASIAACHARARSPEETDWASTFAERTRRLSRQARPLWGGTCGVRASGIAYAQRTWRELLLERAERAQTQPGSGSV